MRFEDFHAADDFRLPLAQVRVGDRLEIVDVIEINIVEQVDRRLEIARHREIDQEKGTAFAAFQEGLELRLGQHVMRRAGGADDDVDVDGAAFPFSPRHGFAAKLKRQGLRTVDRAQALAAELGGEAVRWEDWESHAVDADIMISSTSAPHYMLTREKLESLLQKRGHRPLFLIDLAVPRDFEPSINLLDDVYLYDIDDLQSIAQAHLRERQTEITRSLEILQPHIARYMAWAARQDDAPEGGDLPRGLVTV